MKKSIWGANASLILGAAAFLLGLVRLIADEGSGRWLGLLMVIVGLLGVAGGLTDRSTARKAAQVRASLTPGDRAVVLQDVGGRRIEVIRQVRESLGVGLAEAKQATDAPGAVVVSGVAPDIAEAVADRLRAVGATVEVVAVEAAATSEGPHGLQ